MSTKIEWVTNPDGTKGEAWNPITGCTKISPGCKNCYAARMARRLAGRHGYPEAPNHFDVTGHPDRLGQPYRWRKPRRVFVCSMGDLFHKNCHWLDIEQIFKIMLDHKNRKHTFQLLTKRAASMQEFVSECYPDLDQCAPHIWLGVTAEDQKRANERIHYVLQTSAAVRFVSVEPMLGPVVLPEIWEYVDPDGFENNGPMVSTIGLASEPDAKIDWVIIGCESGPGRRPMKLEWAIDLVKQCKAANVAVFVKQVEVNGKVSHDPTEWPTGLRVREYPSTGTGGENH